jgi:hypothetical protein
MTMEIAQAGAEYFTEKYQPARIIVAGRGKWT